MAKNPVFLSHSGKQHSYHVAKALKNLGRLYRFYTSSYITSPFLQGFFKKRGDTFWTRRFEEGLGGKDVKAHWEFELKEVLIRKFQGKSALAQQAVYERDESFDRMVAKTILKSKGDFIYWGFQGSCLESLKAGNETGRRTVCELATAHVGSAKKILGEESSIQPEWADSIDNLVFPFAYEKRLYEEPHKAELVVAASVFTEQSLLEDGVKKEKISVLPLGVDVSHIDYLPKRFEKKGRIKVLFAGTVTQRKGMSYLLEAFESISAEIAELSIIGGVQGSGEAFRKTRSKYVYKGAVAQSELFGLYKDYDLLILPSLFEGFGLVLVEAMAAGLPVIATPNTMAPDLVEEGKNGYIVPIRNSSKIKEAIEKYASLDGNEKEEMSAYARKTALKMSWVEYEKRLEEFLAGLG